jgi:hypothetical protein
MVKGEVLEWLSATTTDGEGQVVRCYQPRTTMAVRGEQ